MSQSAGILRNYFYSINYDQSILLLNNAGLGDRPWNYAKADYEVIHKASDRYEAWIILSKSIVTRIMGGFELEIIILKNNDMIEKWL